MIERLRTLRRSKFVRDTLVLQAGKFTLLALSLFSSVIVWRLMGPKAFGIFALAQSFLIIWQSLDFSGVGTSTSTRLAIAIGARDEAAILDLLAFYVKVNVAVNLALTLSIALLGAPVSAALYDGSTRIVALAFWMSVAATADGIYGLVMISLQSRRSMRTFALMQNANQVVLTICSIVAILVSPTPESLMVGRLVYSYGTLVMALVVYSRQRAQGAVAYPPISAVLRRARTVSPRPYWRFGVANAIDKNLAELFIQLPLQLVGIYAGARAVGYLQLALNGIGQAGIFTGAVLDNMQAVVPQAVGRKDFAGLWRNFRRVLLALAFGGVTLYGALALVGPIVIPPVLGARWVPAIAPLALLALYGAITTVGGIFGPLYRAFNLMGRMIAMRVVSLALVLPLGALLLMHAAPPAIFGLERYIAYNPMRASAGALIGAGMIDAVYLISVALTAALTLPELRKKAR